MCLAPLPQRLPHSPTDLDPFPTNSSPFLVSYSLSPHRFAHRGFLESPFPQVQLGCPTSLKLPGFRQSVKQKLFQSHIKLELIMSTRSNEISPRLSVKKRFSVFYCSPLCLCWICSEALRSSVLMATGTAFPWLGTAQQAGCCVSSPGVNLTFLRQ